MAVIEVLTFDVKPGRLEDFVESVRRLKGVLERVDVDLESVRLFRAMVAGPESGRVSVMVENTNLSSWGQSLENEIQDPEDREISALWFGPDSPVTMVDRRLMRDLPL